MSIRLMCCSVLVVGASLFGMACGPTIEAEEQSQPQEQQARGDFCGGIAGFPCDEGLTCVDDPKDDCDPEQGGADCGGICIKEKKKPACDKEPGQKYISRDPTECTLINFICVEGYTPFFNECGCGCQKTKHACDYNDPKRSYISKDPDTCAVIRFACAEGFAHFSNECGCGCERIP
jgi:hypothetical protein